MVMTDETLASIRADRNLTHPKMWGNGTMQAVIDHLDARGERAIAIAVELESECATLHHQLESLRDPIGLMAVAAAKSDEEGMRLIRDWLTETVNGARA
jgi:hypothetical protein